MNGEQESIEARIEYALMVHFFGDDRSAVWAANAMRREGTRSMGQLDRLARQFSEAGFRQYLLDLHMVGELVAGRIIEGLSRFRAGDETERHHGFQRRLLWTARYLRDWDRTVDLFPGVKDDEGNSAGLTPGDLALLARLFGHVK